MDANANSEWSEGPDSLHWRLQKPEDERFLREVYGAARKEEMVMTGWRPEQCEAFLDQQFKAMRAGYAAQFPKAAFLVIMLALRPIGFMVLDRPAHELRLVDIALLEEFRGRGIGSFYLRQLAAEADAAKKPFRLHVFKGSRPWRLYARMGFVKIEDHGPYEHLEKRPGANR